MLDYRVNGATTQWTRPCTVQWPRRDTSDADNDPATAKDPERKGKSMTPQAIELAAQALIEARRSRRMLDALPEGCRPGTPEEGYAVQRAVITAWGEPVAGWKSGATLEAVQQRFGLTEPFLGPFFGSSVMRSPARAKVGLYEHRILPVGTRPGVALEVEFAFRVAKVLPPKAGGYTRDEILEAFDAVIPAFEIISPRFHATPFGNPGSALADCGLNGGMVLGQPVKDWRGIDYANHTARLVVDAKTIAEGTGALVLGNPLNALEWLVNAVGRQGHMLSPGQVLTTGSMTGIVYVDQGAEAVGDFGALGTVVATFE